MQTTPQSRIMPMHPGRVLFCFSRASRNKQLNIPMDIAISSLFGSSDNKHLMPGDRCFDVHSSFASHFILI